MLNLFRAFRRPRVTIAALRAEPFTPKYEEQCRMIWRQWVPQQGQSDVLQGEMLRAVEKLRYEALDNGNINWNDEFCRLCDFLLKHLTEKRVYSRQEKERFVVILDFLRENGEYVRAFNEGRIPEDDADVARFPDEADEKFYDMLADGVGKMYAAHPSPIARELDPECHV